MCDVPGCGEIFSELEDGWGTSQTTKVIETGDGNRKTITVMVDTCPEHTGDTKEVARKLREARKARRIERLELETGDSIERELELEERRHAGE